MTWLTRLILSALLMSALGYFYQNGVISEIMSRVLDNMEESESYDYDDERDDREYDSDDYAYDDFDNSDTNY